MAADWRGECSVMNKSQQRQQLSSWQSPWPGSAGTTLLEICLQRFAIREGRVRPPLSISAGEADVSNKAAAEHKASLASFGWGLVLMWTESIASFTELPFLCNFH